MAQKSLSSCDAHELRRLFDHDHPEISVSRQFALLGLPRSTLYYQPTPVRESTLRIMARIDALYLEDPWPLLMRTKVRISADSAMRTTLELPDPLFARLKARAAHERMTLKQLLRNYVEQGLNAVPPAAAPQRTAATLPQLNSPLSISTTSLSNATLFELLDS